MENLGCEGKGKGETLKIVFRRVTRAAREYCVYNNNNNNNHHHHQVIYSASTTIT